MAQTVSSISLDFLSPRPSEAAITSSRMDVNLLFHSEVLASTSPVIISHPTPSSRPGIAVRRQALLYEESASFIPVPLHAPSPPIILRTSLPPSSLEVVTPANADRSRIPITSSIFTLILPPAQEARTTTVTFRTHSTSIPQVALPATAAIDRLIPAPSCESREYLRHVTHLSVTATTTTAPLPAMKSVLEPTQPRLTVTSFTINPTSYPPLNSRLTKPVYTTPLATAQHHRTLPTHVLKSTLEDIERRHRT